MNHTETTDHRQPAYRVSDGHADIECSTLPEARRVLDDWIKDGSWEDSENTWWLDVTLYKADGRGGWECIDGLTHTVAPTEPPCDDDGEHWWTDDVRIVGGIDSSPGVWGHGGGVRCHEACRICGASRVTDTWAQRPDTGEEGLDSIEYQEAHYAEIFDARRSLERYAAILGAHGTLSHCEQLGRDTTCGILGLDWDDYLIEFRATDQWGYEAYEGDETIVRLQRATMEASS